MLFFILFLISLFSSFFSQFELKVLKLSFLIYGTSFLLMLMTFSDKNPYSTFKKVTKIQMIIGSICSILAIFLFTFGKLSIISGKSVQMVSVGPFRIYQIIMGKYPYYRVASLTTNPNTLGMILMISQIATIYLYKIKDINKIKFYIFYILQIMALILTQSRAAILTTIIIIIIFNVLNSKNQIKRLKIYGVMIFLVIIGYYLLATRDIGMFSRFSTGLSERNLPWQMIIERIKINPFLGVGFGVSGDSLLKNIEIKAHNLFLNSFVETGLAGLIVFCSIWLMGIIYSFKKIKVKNETEKMTYIVIFSMLIALVFHQLFENKILVYDFFMFFWIYLITFSAGT